MGEVYRADDLTLGQPVALKFLPPHVARDEGRLQRFRKEAAAARRVAHPNVCRVYDIADHDGQPFLTMEYIDGENLASLLKRVGRLPEEKGVEVARQLCAALGAVHDQGLLHRDLKPANVMLDGRGGVRLTDFGLAAVAAELTPDDRRAGTPLYMAPEQHSGNALSAQTDLFALGLVLFELFIGKRAFAGDSRDNPPSKPSSHIAGLNPAIERAILRCLEQNPASRPRSANALLAELPGGNPLAVALARGETPSPEAVANAPVEGTLRPPVALALLVAVFAALVLAAGLADRAVQARHLPFRRASPPVLTAAAENAREALGHTRPPEASASGYAWDVDYIRYARETDPSPSRWASQADARPPAVRFWYRESPSPFPTVTQVALRIPGVVSWDDPPPVIPGMSGIALDLRGRLVEYFAVAPFREPSEGPTSLPDWTVPFGLAGLERSQFRAVSPEWRPPVYCDSMVAWEGLWPGRSDLLLRVEGGTFRGRVVWFKLIGPWEDDRPGGVFGSRPWLQPGQVVWLALVWLTLIVGGVAVYRHTRSGRADLRRGGRLFAVLFVLQALAGLFTVWNSVPSIALGTSWFLSFLGFCVFWAAVQTVAYLAQEPYLRRKWPYRIVSWSRLLDGRVRDPLVGRDVLIGIVFGLVFTLCLTVRTLGPTWLGMAVPSPELGWWLNSSIVPFLLMSADHGVLNATVWMLAILIVTSVCRRDWLAWGVLMAVGTIVMSGSLAGADMAIGLTATPAIVAIAIEVMRRVGLLAMAVGVFVGLAIDRAPLTLDFSAWYGGRGLAVFAIVGLLTVYGSVVSLGGRSLFTGNGRIGGD
jgi:serine/threonine-protein kinase